MELLTIETHNKLVDYAISKMGEELKKVKNYDPYLDENNWKSEDHVAAFLGVGKRQMRNLREKFGVAKDGGVIKYYMPAILETLKTKYKQSL